MVLLSITGLFRTVLIIIGVFVLLRFLGKLMIAKRNLEENERTLRAQRESEEMIANARKNYGQTTLSKPGLGGASSKADFADYEEINE